LLLVYVQNKFFWAQQNFGGTKEILGGTAPEFPPLTTGLRQ